MTMHHQRTVALLALLSLFTATTRPTSAFTIVAARHAASSPTTLPSRLQALIYGWDQADDDTTATSFSSSPSYLDVGSDFYSGASCSPVGSAVAEALTVDPDRVGHLARLAVAFAPPHQALSLDKIDRVEVVCVRDDSIDIEAMICDGTVGCVSLSVPVKFPWDCAGGGHNLEGCVLRNLDELNTQAGSLLTSSSGQDVTEKEFEELCVLNEKVDNFPSWWIPPENNAALVHDCETIRQLLNDDEFQRDIRNLSQDALSKLEAEEDYTVLQAKVAIVGPAGMCFKVRAQQHRTHDIQVLDVVYAFAGGQAVTTVEDLRAAVLGAVAAAEGN